jgi:hypothetical protein
VKSGVCAAGLPARAGLAGRRCHVARNVVEPVKTHGSDHPKCSFAPRHPARRKFIDMLPPQSNFEKNIRNFS